MSAVLVRAPATSANLGSGFDCLGLALGLWNEVSARPLPSGAPPPDDNLIQAAARAVYDAVGAPFPGFDLRCTNRIPFGRGLGSSAAAIVSGVLLANAHLGRPLNEADLLRLACELEGHPDNVVPCLLGGVRVAARDDAGRLLQVGVPLGLTLCAVVFVPDLALSTAVARGRLPSSVPMADALFNLGRASLLVAALAAGQADLLAEATRDRLHQPYRLELFPAAADLRSAALCAGALAAYTSGAGPSVLALCADDEARTTAVATALTTTADAAGVAGASFTLDISLQGAHVVDEPR